MSLKSTSSTRNCVDWTTKWHRKSKVEHSSIFHRFWKSNRRWVIQVESMSFFWRGYAFHNRQSIDRMLMWYFNVESMGNRRRCVCWIHFYLIFSREICVGQRWKNSGETLRKRNSSSYSFSSEMNQGCCILPSKVILRFFLQYPRQ